MPHELYRFLEFLDENRFWYRLDRTRPGVVRVNVPLPGERIEIEVFEDEHFEITRFTGDESVESGAEAIAQLYAQLRAAKAD
jgi:hypothetical protein